MRHATGWMGMMILAIAAGGCAPGGRTGWGRAAEVGRPPDAEVQIKGLACPYCTYNVERSLSQIEGIERVRTDLNTGIATIWFDGRHRPAPEAIWDAILESGFTPVRVVIGDESYVRPG